MDITQRLTVVLHSFWWQARGVTGRGNHNCGLKWKLGRSSPQAAFTLVEVLTVVGIVAVLGGVLIPSLLTARQAARTTACQSNLRQWATAVVIYANSNSGYLPRRGQGAQPTAIIDRPSDWFNALPPILGLARYAELSERKRIPRPKDASIWMCPEAVDAEEENYFAYAMNMLLSTWNAPRPDRIDRVAPPSVQVFMADGPGPYCSILPADRPYSPVARHRGYVNLNFLDGHAARFAGHYVGCGSGDPSRGDVRWRVPNSPWPGPSN